MDDRSKILINNMINMMIEQEGNHCLPVIKQLLDCGFTEEELVDEFSFDAGDVSQVIEEG